MSNCMDVSHLQKRTVQDAVVKSSLLTAISLAAESPRPSNPKPLSVPVKGTIAAAGSADMHEIAASAFETLRKYYLFFRAQAEG